MERRKILHKRVRVTDSALRKAGAQRRLAAEREVRLIIEAAIAGRSQTAIAKLVGVSQPHISRTIAAVKRQNDGHLRVEPKSALDIIDERDAGKIDTRMMMRKLGNADYTDGHVPDVDGVATDAYVRGSWDDIEYAFQQDRLTFEQYSELFRAHRASRKTAVAYE